MHALFNLLAAILPLRNKMKARTAQMQYMKSKRIIIEAARKAILPPALRRHDLIEKAIIVDNNVVPFVEILKRRSVAGNVIGNKGE